jgi:hypothetical protein
MLCSRRGLHVSHQHCQTSLVSINRRGLKLIVGTLTSAARRRELYPSLIQLLISQHDSHFKPSRAADISTLCNRKFPFFLEGPSQNLNWWLEKKAALEKEHPGDIARQHAEIKRFQGYVYSTDFQISIDLLYHEVLFQTRVGALRPAVRGRLQTDSIGSRNCG